MSSNRWLLAAGVGLVVLVVASIAVGTTRRAETPFPEGSPERAVQLYVRAVEAGDAVALHALLSPEAQKRCELATIRQSLRFPNERDLRVTLRDSNVTGESAVIRVRVTESTGSQPFESGTYDHDETFDLVRATGAWLIDQPTWPVYCPPNFPTPFPTPTPVPTATPSPTTTALPSATTPPGNTP